MSSKKVIFIKTNFFDIKKRQIKTSQHPKRTHTVSTLSFIFFSSKYNNNNVNNTPNHTKLINKRKKWHKTSQHYKQS